jgi:hypothetical protein
MTGLRKTQTIARANGFCFRSWKKNEDHSVFIQALKRIQGAPLSLLMIFFLLAGCLPVQESRIPPAWKYSDLRILAAPGVGPETHQLVGLYTRTYQSSLQIRLDLFDYDPGAEFDLYLALDTQPGGLDRLPIDAQAGLQWDVLLIIPASGPLQAIGPGGEVMEGLSMRVSRNPSLDTLTISLDQSAAGSSFRIQAWITGPGSPQHISSLGPVRSDARPPARTPVVLVFWNTFPAYTPSQALRRLDGAHTGPASDRHGLRGLLDALERANFPAVLLDLKTPALLSALDYSGALPRVRALVSRDLLILPDVFTFNIQPVSSFVPPDWAFVQAALRANHVREGFDLPPSPFLYTTNFPSGISSLPREANHRLIFTNSASITSPQGNEGDKNELDPSSTGPAPNLKPIISRWQAYTVVDMTSVSQDLLESTQATYTGPSIEIRRALLEAAVDPTKKSFIVLGGDLGFTSWGNATAATQTLLYLKSRPWLQPLGPAGLVATSSTQPAGLVSQPSPTEIESIAEAFIPVLPDGEATLTGLAVDQIHTLLLEEMKRAQVNSASNLAWQAYEALMAVPLFPDPDLLLLRAGYLGQIGHLLAASSWEKDGPQAFCNEIDAEGFCTAALDLDWDGELEYIMASEDIFLLFEARGGYLSTAFCRGQEGAYQVIAPSSQFIVGMGDPMTWDVGQGVAGDPAQYRGAFSDIATGFSYPSWEVQDVEIGSNSLSFITPDGSLQKNFFITRDGLIANYNSSTPITVQIPLAVDPAARFSPGWGSRYLGSERAGGWLWGLKDGPKVNLWTSGDLSISAFSDSFEYMGQPENPDLDFPPGHFLPFPMALGEINARGEFVIQVTMMPD